jgi:hypothetical protein
MTVAEAKWVAWGDRMGRGHAFKPKAAANPMAARIVRPSFPNPALLILALHLPHAYRSILRICLKAVHEQ